MKNNGIYLGLSMMAFVCLFSGCESQAPGFTKISAATLPLTFIEPDITVFQGPDGTRQVYSRFTPAADVVICNEDDFQNLSRLTYVKNLTISGCSSGFTISGLAPLKGLTHLEALNASNLDITDLSALAGLVNLKDLALFGNQIQDLSPLCGLHNLEELRLFSNRIRDLSPLSGLTRLRFLSLDCNPIQDITPLSGLDRQTRLSLEQTNLAWNDWAPVKGFANVDGRPATVNAGILPCPQEWVDRIRGAYPDGLILSLDYDDYNGDGVYEAFAFVSDREIPADTADGYGGAFLMITQDSIKELVSRDHGLLPGEYFRFGNTKIVRLDYINSYSSSISLLWTADGSSPRSMNLSGMGQYFHVDGEGNICMLHSTYDGTSDMMGHSYSPIISTLTAMISWSMGQ